MGSYVVLQMRQWGKFIKRYLTSVHKVVFGDMSNLSIQVASNSLVIRSITGVTLFGNFWS
jgi:hypothetical protein